MRKRKREEGKSWRGRYPTY